jgi:hypothetical protein
MSILIKRIEGLSMATKQYFCKDCKQRITITEQIKNHGICQRCYAADDYIPLSEAEEEALSKDEVEHDHEGI